ncbi:copper resistance CopC family protein [Streptomonospora wellingtoniae]|uniref:Copper resistance protein CopC n=1 Tax=Streptomonospora wellingtoniae TaxID=3075544 RepID=A0ABU2KYP5_9ACTN|nr:copper resistance protein CopC [Streptomonospora sp. DSM 45055]MDT0304362.1 copper resistance protein CopC [Streptomonospora sp. DSM 45055]
MNLATHAAPAPDGRRHPSAARRPAVVAAALLGSLALATATAPGALAHDSLIDSSPKDGAELDTAPGEVVLTFSSDMGQGSNAIVVTGPEGENHEEGEVEVDGAEAAIGVGELPAAGEYTVAYRTVSSDGHTLEDEITFSLTEEAVPEPDPSPEGEASAQGGDGSTGGAEAEEPPAAQSPTDPSNSLLGPVGAVVAGIAVLALIAILLIRMRNRPGSGGGNG